MAGVNKVILLGRLGRDPEVRNLQSGGTITNLSVATSETWKDKGGERQERTEWHRVVIFNEKLGEIAEKYLKKGSQVYLEGTIQSRKWVDKDGAERVTTEIVLPRFGGAINLIDSGEGRTGRDSDRRDSDRGSERRDSGTSQRRETAQSSRNDLDDDIPF